MKSIKSKLKFSIFIITYLILLAFIIYFNDFTGDTTCSISDDKVVIKVAHANIPAPNDPYQYVTERFKELMEKNDKVVVELYPNAEYGGEQRIFQHVMNGVVQVGFIASNNASVFSPSLSVLDLPYLFKDRSEFKEVIQKLNTDFTEIMIKESGIRPIGWAVQGFRAISNSKKPIRCLDDLKGLRIRVPNNPVQVATFKAWGLDPVPMTVNEAFSAIQQDIVDGLDMTYAELANQNFYKVQKFYTDLGCKLTVEVMVVSEEWFQSLPKDVQSDILDAGIRATLDNSSIFKDLEEEGKTVLKEKGGTVLDRPRDEKIWKQKAMRIWPKFYPSIKDPDILDKVLDILKIKKPVACVEDGLSFAQLST